MFEFIFGLFGRFVGKQENVLEDDEKWFTNLKNELTKEHEKLNLICSVKTLDIIFKEEFIEYFNIPFDKAFQFSTNFNIEDGFIEKLASKTLSLKYLEEFLKYLNTEQVYHPEIRKEIYSKINPLDLRINYKNQIKYKDKDIFLKYEFFTKVENGESSQYFKKEGFKKILWIGNHLETPTDYEYFLKLIEDKYYKEFFCKRCLSKLINKLKPICKRIDKSNKDINEIKDHIFELKKIFQELIVKELMYIL